jgi:hypothetical protein
MEERNLGLLSVNDISEASFADAAGMWLSTRHHHLAPRTYKDYANYIATLAKHFGRTKLLEITGDQIRTYQRKRMRQPGRESSTRNAACWFRFGNASECPLQTINACRCPRIMNRPGVLSLPTRKRNSNKSSNPPLSTPRGKQPRLRLFSQ